MYSKRLSFPKEFNFNSQIYESSPIKPVPLENEKEVMDEIVDLLVSDTPSKNLCCIGKGHTPSKPKVIFSANVRLLENPKIYL
jgi:hypothetical protein